MESKPRSPPGRVYGRLIKDPSPTPTLQVGENHIRFTLSETVVVYPTERRGTAFVIAGGIPYEGTILLEKNHTGTIVMDEYTLTMNIYPNFKFVTDGLMQTLEPRRIDKNKVYGIKNIHNQDVKLHLDVFGPIQSDRMRYVSAHYASLDSAVKLKLMKPSSHSKRIIFVQHPAEDVESIMSSISIAKPMRRSSGGGGRHRIVKKQKAVRVATKTRK